MINLSTPPQTCFSQCQISRQMFGHPTICLSHPSTVNPCNNWSRKGFVQRDWGPFWRNHCGRCAIALPPDNFFLYEIFMHCNAMVFFFFNNLYRLFYATEKNSLSFIETSALDSTNVETAFKNILTGKQPCLFPASCIAWQCPSISGLLLCVLYCTTVGSMYTYPAHIDQIKSCCLAAFPTLLPRVATPLCISVVGLYRCGV